MSFLFLSTVKNFIYTCDKLVKKMKVKQADTDYNVQVASIYQTQLVN